MGSFVCEQLAATVPYYVSCPSFDQIASDPHNGSISMFCRTIMHHFCFQNFSSDREIQLMYENAVCKTPIDNINTISEVGMHIRLKLNKEYHKYCMPMTRFSKHMQGNVTSHIVKVLKVLSELN